MISSTSMVLPSLRLLLLALAAVAATPDFEVQQSDGGAPGAPAQIVATVLKGAGEQPGAPPSGASPSPNAYMALISNGAPHFRAFGPLGGHPCGVRTKVLTLPLSLPLSLSPSLSLSLSLSLCRRCR